MTESVGHQPYAIPLPPLLVIPVLVTGTNVGAKSRHCVVIGGRDTPAHDGKYTVLAQVKNSGRWYGTA